MKKFKEYLTEQQLIETLVMYNNGASFGQCVFVIGGGASGKGFSINNFVDSRSFKIIDPDNLKSLVLARNKKTHSYPELDSINMSKSSDVGKMHQFVKDKGWDKKVQANALNQNPSSLAGLKNIMFDTAVSDIGSLKKKIRMVLDAGYEPKNIHITWILRNYNIALQANKNVDRGRVVPDDILLQAHENSAYFTNNIMKGDIPDGVDGSVTVVLNNVDKMVYHGKIQFVRSPTGKLLFDKTGKQLTTTPITDFMYLTIKRPGQPPKNERENYEKLYSWIIANAPESVIHSNEIDSKYYK